MATINSVSGGSERETPGNRGWSRLSLAPVEAIHEAGISPLSDPRRDP